MSQETLIWVALAVAVLVIALFVFVGRASKSATEETPAIVVEEPTPTPAADTPSPFLAAPQGEVDDLRRIKGIGPKLEKMLRELGVYHYQQIADWTPEQMLLVDSKLENFSGRPERDQWQSQAALLASGDIKAYERAHGKLGPDAAPPPAG